MEYRFYLLLLLFSVFLCPDAAQAQTDGQLPGNEYRAWVTSMDGKYTTSKRFLTHVQDSLIILANEMQSESTQFYYYNIDKLSLRKKGSPGRGILIGAIGGFAAGFIMGYAEASNCSGFLCFSPVGIGAAIGGLLTIPGGVIGAVAGAGRINIPINGRTQNQRQEIMKRIKF